MLEKYSDILTVEEACEALRVGYNAMYELLNSGKVKAGLINNLCKCFTVKRFVHPNNAAKQGNAEERSAAGCAIIE